MTITKVGTLPVSGINLGLAAGAASIAEKVTKLTADISKLTAALDTQLSVTANFPPNLAGYAVAFAATLDPTALASAFNPLNWITLNAGANLSLLADLALADAQIALVEPTVLDLEAGLAAPGIVGWSYSGRAAGFGRTLEAATRAGFPSAGPDRDVSAIIIACADFASWGAFSAGFHTGDSSIRSLPATTDEERLRFLGSLGGGQWNTGAQALLSGLSLLLSGLRGAKSGAEAQIDLSLGIGLPDPSAIVNAGLSIDIDAALASMVSVQTDLTATIGAIQADSDATLSLTAELDAQLSAGGLTLWAYSGPASGLGSAFAPEVASGLPGAGSGPDGAIWGAAVACADPGAWAGFGRVVATG